MAVGQKVSRVSLKVFEFRRTIVGCEEAEEAYGAKDEEIGAKGTG